MLKNQKYKRIIKDCQYSKHVIFLQQDIYYRKAKQDCFRARSAYKLLQIDQLQNIFKNAQRIIDLCAAPGSWSQVCAKKLQQKGFFNKSNINQSSYRIIAVDLQQMAAIQNVYQIQGDITKRKTVQIILEKFQNKKASLILSDGAHDVTGLHDVDQYNQSQLLVAALNICKLAMQNGGIFVGKIFKANDIKFLYCQFKVFFNEVNMIKPSSSRESSIQYFIICKDFKGTQIKSQLYVFSPELIEEENQKQKRKYNFITCGDLTLFEQDVDVQNDN